MAKHLYSNERGDWFVADGLEQVARLARTYYHSEGIPPTDELTTFALEPDDSVLDFGTGIARPCGEWAAESEPGFFAEAGD
jgi:hypothetical protein